MRILGMEIDDNTLCPRCGKEKAVLNRQYGVLPCRKCNAKYSSGTHGSSFVDDGRQEDIADLNQALSRTSSPQERVAIQQQINKIRSESSKIKSMRQELVKAMREGNAENVRDINEWVAKREDYR